MSEEEIKFMEDYKSKRLERILLKKQRDNFNLTNLGLEKLIEIEKFLEDNYDKYETLSVLDS